MSTANDTKPKARRSSLRTHDPNNKLDSAALMKLKEKRNSVSWGQSNTFQFKAMKAMFQESSDVDKPKKETEEKHKQFIESRKKSIKNEFSIVKELMKNKNIIEEDELDEELKNNTNKNMQFGKDALNEESESSSSSESESDEDDEKDEKDNEEEQNKKKE